MVGECKDRNRKGHEQKNQSKIVSEGRRSKKVSNLKDAPSECAGKEQTL